MSSLASYQANSPSQRLPGDFWSITLPSDLATSAARGPSMFAFFASLNVLDARALYSNHSVRELMDPALQGPRSSLERHHLFPVAYLKQQIQDQRDYNQIANFAIVESGRQHRDFSRATCRICAGSRKTLRCKSAPGYVSPSCSSSRLAEHELRNFPQRATHPDRPNDQDGVLERLAGQTQAAAPQLSRRRVDWIRRDGWRGIKSTLRTNLHTGEKDPRMGMSRVEEYRRFPQW